MEQKHSLRPGEIPCGAMAFIARGLSEIGSGRIVLTAQDSRLVSVEREERIGGDTGRKNRRGLRWALAGKDSPVIPGFALRAGHHHAEGRRGAAGGAIDAEPVHGAGRRRNLIV